MSKKTQKQLVEEQFEAFWMDALIPDINARTPPRDAYKAYLKYCEAIQQDALMPDTFFFRRLSKMYLKRSTDTGFKYCFTIRPDLFVYEEVLK